MQLNISFAQSVTFKKVMHLRNCAVRTLSSQNIFINKEVYLVRDCLTTKAKECTFSRCLEINYDLQGNEAVARTRTSNEHFH